MTRDERSDRAEDEQVSQPATSDPDPTRRAGPVVKPFLPPRVGAEEPSASLAGSSARHPEGGREADDHQDAAAQAGEPAESPLIEGALAAILNGEAHPPDQPLAPPLQHAVQSLCDGLLSDPETFLDLSYNPESVTRYLPRHSHNVARLAMFVGMRAGYREPTIKVLGLCGLMHDLGMNGIPDTMLNRATSLSTDEREVVRKHPAQGALLTRSFDELDNLIRLVVPTVVAQHHERVDGSGYPNGLTAPRIHHLAKLLSIVDSYEAMVSPRIYKSPMLPNQAIETIILQTYVPEQAPRFEESLVESFVKAVSLYPIGSYVLLNSDEIAKVVDASTRNVKRPVVRILRPSENGQLEGSRVVDLSHCRDLAIVHSIPDPALAAA